MRNPLQIPEKPPGIWPRFHSELHSEAVAARVGRLLGIAFGLCFVTGLLSHYQYSPWHWLPIPGAPTWGYRVTQGVHVITGIASIPLLIAKLWTVTPRLWQWPPVKSAVHGLERGSIAVLVSSAILQLTTGLLNTMGWYPWPWSFVYVHFWLSWIVIGSLVLHIAVKLPAIQRGLATSLGDRPDTDDNIGLGSYNPENIEIDPADEAKSGSLSRRGLLVATAGGAGVLALTTVGQTFTPLQKVALLGIRRPELGPQGVPINKTASQANITDALVGSGYVLTVDGPKSFTLSLEELEALESDTTHLPIACVEGWSIGASWRGPWLLDIVKRAGGNEDSRVRVVSLQESGSYRDSTIVHPQLKDALLATHINGKRLSRDHGYPLRLIAPNRAGVLQTKWITKIEVS